MHKSDIPNDEISVAGGCAIVALVIVAVVAFLIFGV